jgi:UDPglucose--hexose-1-phosphate uridylyltransferase
MNELSELRRDPVSHDWVVIATGRARRPHDFKRTHAEGPTEISPCPFDDLESSGNPALLTFPGGEDWWVKSIKNKYPLVQGEQCSLIERRGPFEVQAGAGYHEVVVTRDHSRAFGEMSFKEVEYVLQAYQLRYEAMRGLECANYILIFHNHGREAGASISHPHSQIVAIPVIPADVRRSLKGSERYYHEHSQCIHCAMLTWETEQKKRIVFENDHMVALVPYVPRTAFELRIYPKAHASAFERMAGEERASLAEALSVVLSRVHDRLEDPAYNFFVHTSPPREQETRAYYHWHLEILPKAPTPPAGFELGTGIDVSPLNPDDVASFLREDTKAV